MPTIYTSPFPSVSLPKHSVYAHLFPPVDRFPPDSAAFIDGITGKVLTRGELRHDSGVLAWGLVHELGKRGSTNLKRGGTVAAGIRVTFANIGYTPPELRHQLKDSQASHIFVHPNLLPVVIETYKLRGLGLAEVKRRVIIMLPSLNISHEIKSQGWILLDDLMIGDQQLIPEDFSGEKAHETAFLYYSSGTTGLSKGVETTHYNVTSVLEMSKSGWAFQHGQDTMIAVLPFFHIFGGIILSMHPFNLGVTCVVMPRFEPKSFLNALAVNRVTAVLIAPPILVFLADSPMIEPYDLSHITTVLVGAAPASPALMLKARSRLRSRGAKSVEILNAYGLTECSPTTHLLRPDRALEKMGSVGTLLANQEARLVDEDGADVKEGESGEMWIRGANVMKGYLNNPEATKNCMTADGWFQTGDIAVRDKDGHFWIVDRKKELIKYKGWQVPPAELEGLLLSHPHITDAGVIGIYSNEQATELPRAYIVPRDPSILTANQATRRAFSVAVEDWIKNKVAHYKQLRGGAILIAAIPRSAAGKILRKDLRDMAKAELSGAAAKL